MWKQDGDIEDELRVLIVVVAVFWPLIILGSVFVLLQVLD